MPDTPYADILNIASGKPRSHGPRERVHSIASRIGIAPDLVDDYLKVTQVESGHNVNVRDSSKGAKGFGQVMPDRPGTATRTIGSRRYDLRNPDENIEAGLKLFEAGGSDPVARRLEYFGGTGVRRRYERTGRIPNISDGNMTAAQYVRATGGQSREPQPPNPYADILKAAQSSEPPPVQPPVPDHQQVLANLNRSFERGVQQVKQKARQPAPATGSSNLGLLRQLDEPEVARIQRLQAEESARSTGTPTLDYMGVHPRRRASRAATIAARRASEERATEQRQQTEAPELDRLTTRYRQQIREATQLTPNYGPTKWFQEALAKGEAGLVETGAALLRGVSNPVLSPLGSLLTDPTRANQAADRLRLHAEAMQRAAVEEGADRNVVSRTLQDATAGLISTAPELAAVSVGLPPVVTFGAGGAARAYGRGDPYREVLKAAAHGAATGAAFELPIPARLTSTPARAAAKGVTVGGATGAIELASGTPPEQAAATAITNALFGAHGELKRNVTPRRVEQVNREVPESMRDNPDVRALIDKARADARQAIEERKEGRPSGTRQVEPPTVFHAGTTPFTQLEAGRTKVGTKGRGLYFATTPEGTHVYEMAKRSGPVNPSNIKQARLEMKRPLDLTDPAGTQRFFDEVEGLLANPVELAKAAGFSRQWGRATTPKELQANLRGLVDVARGGNPEAARELVGWNPNLTATAKALGYDGIIDAGEHVVFDRSQIRGINEPQVKTQPDVPAQRTAVESTATRPATPEAQMGQPEVPARPDRAVPEPEQRLGGVREAESITEPRLPDTTQRYFHRDYGEVVRAPDQSGARAGRTKVYEVANPDKFHYIKTVQLTGAGNQRAVPVREVSTTPDVEAKGLTPQSRPESSDSSTTAVKNASMSAGRAARDLPELAQAQPRKAAEVHQRAIEANRTNPRAVDRLTEQALNTDRTYTDVETAQLRLRAQEIKNREAELFREIDSAIDPSTIQAKRLELDSLTSEFDRLSQATRKAGTEWGRAGVARQQAIDQDFSLVAMKARLKAAKGETLTETENAKVEQLYARNRELEAKLAEANDRAAQTSLQKRIDRVSRTRQRTESKAQLDTEWIALKSQFAEIRQREASFFKSESGEFNPEALKLIARMARNRIHAGVTNAAQLVDDIHAITGGDKREVRDAISGYGRFSQRQQSETTKQLAQIRSDLKRLSATEDIATGKRLSPRDQTRQAQLLKQQADLQRRIETGDFSTATRPKPEYNRETRKLEEQLQSTRNQYQLLLERAKPGHFWRTLSGLRKSWMLSGLTTQAKNIGGTGGWQAFEEVARLPAVIADAAVAPFTGQRSVSGPSPVAALDSVLHAIRTGGREASQILRTGATKEQLERHQFSEIDTGIKALDIASNAVFRFMSASDRVFYQLAYKRNLTDRAVVQARNEKLTREQQRELVDNPPEPLDAAAKHDALVATFNNNNKLSDAIKSGRARLGPKTNFAIDLVMPFDRTPTNVIARIAEASPIGAGQATYRLAKSAINKSITVEEQRQFSRTMGRATTGTALVALGWVLADKLFDVDEYQVFLKLGSQRINLNSISPVGNLLALGARLRKNYQAGDAGEAAKTLTRVPLDQPLIRAGTELGEVVRDPERSAVRSGARIASSFVPFGGMVRDIAKTTDREDKRHPDSKSFTQQLKQGIPGLRQQLPVSRSKVFQGQSQSSPGTRETQRLNIRITGASISPVETPAGYQQRRAAMNPAIVSELDQLVTSQRYQIASDEAKKKLIRSLISRVAAQYRPQPPGRSGRPTRPSRATRLSR